MMFLNYTIITYIIDLDLYELTLELFYFSGFRTVIIY